MQTYAQIGLKPFVMWNFINLLVAEGGWFLKLIVILIGASAISFLLKKGFALLQEQFSLKHKVWQEAFVKALYTPLNVYFWVLVITYLINMVTDNYVTEQLLYFARLMLSVTAVLCLSWFLLGWKNLVILALVEKQKRQEYGIEPAKIHAFGKLISALIAAVSVLFLMEVTGVSVQTLLAFGGISGLALAIASQDIVGNFFGGFMIYVTRPFAVADFIRLPSSNLEGYVEDIGWYQTMLRTSDKKPVYIPNSLFSKSYVINDSRKTHRRIQETISIRHQDLAKAQKVMESIRKYLSSLEGIDASEKMKVYIAAVSPYSVDIAVSALSFYTDELEFLRLKDAILLHIGEILAGQGVEIATQGQTIVTVQTVNSGNLE